MMIITKMLRNAAALKGTLGTDSVDSLNHLPPLSGSEGDQGRGGFAQELRDEGELVEDISMQASGL